MPILTGRKEPRGHIFRDPTGMVGRQQGRGRDSVPERVLLEQRPSKGQRAIMGSRRQGGSSQADAITAAAAITGKKGNKGTPRGRHEPRAIHMLPKFPTTKLGFLSFESMKAQDGRPCPSSVVPRSVGTISTPLLPPRKRKNSSPGCHLPLGQLLGWGIFLQPSPFQGDWGGCCWEVSGIGNMCGQTAGNRQGRYTHELLGTGAM